MLNEHSNCGSTRSPTIMRKLRCGRNTKANKFKSTLKRFALKNAKAITATKYNKTSKTYNYIKKINTH